MPVVRAGPNQYLLVGHRGRLQNRGSAVQAILLPGAIYVLVPATKQEAAFEFTQETRDGIPLRFKGIVIYRITDPAAAARLFDFSAGVGLTQISALLTHVCLGELRHAVSHMTMAECIEQRKTTLSGVVETALRSTIHNEDGQANDWGISVEVAQVAQVFIVDAQLRQQLEAEVRNEIKLKSDQSNILAQQETRLAEMESAGRVEEKQLANDRESLRRKEEMELAQLARQRRMQAENLATERQALQLEQEKFHAQLDVEQDRVNTETPVRLLENREGERSPSRGTGASEAAEPGQGVRSGGRTAANSCPAGASSRDAAAGAGTADRGIGLAGAAWHEPVHLRREQPTPRSTRSHLRIPDARSSAGDTGQCPAGTGT